MEQAQPWYKLRFWGSMAAGPRDVPDWKDFEQLVARIEKDAGPLGLVVTSPDWVLCKITGRKREVDASIRSRAGTTNILITIECRKRHPKQDVTWIEQLVTKRDAIGAACTIAVSSSGFTPNAVAVANRHGIQLRRLSEVSAATINALMRLDFVVFPHKRAAPVRVALRFARGEGWRMPDPNEVDMVLPETTDLYAPIFRNTETNTTWSLNDLWRQLQEVANPFGDIEKGQPPVIRTACFPYAGNVTVETEEGPKVLGDVLLSMALWLEIEEVWLDDARKVEYTSPERTVLQRVEFISQQREDKDWRISLQMPTDSADLSELRTEMSQPTPKKSPTKSE
jgi:hypothetical protein